MKGNHKDILQQNVDAAEREYKASLASEQRFRKDLDGERAKIASLDQRLAASALATAKGERSEDPASITAERDRHAHRARGLEQLLAEAVDDFQVANLKLREAQKALLAHLDAEKMEQLEAAIVDATAKRDAAKAALDAAEKVRGDALWARENERKRQEREQRDKAKAAAEQAERESLRKRSA
ncbi:MAG: hypothetical protein ACLGSD_13850 [Acidobacteriota bacterium]